MRRARAYKLAVAEGGHTIRVPKEIADRVPEDVRFIPVVVKDGILMRAIRVSDLDDNTAAWLTGQSTPPPAPTPEHDAVIGGRMVDHKTTRSQPRGLKDPEKAKTEPATKGQTWAIFCGLHVDVRPLSMTKFDASTLIDRSQAGDVSSAEVQDLVAAGAIDHRKAKS